MTNNRKMLPYNFIIITYINVCPDFFFFYVRLLTFTQEIQLHKEFHNAFITVL